MLFMVSGIFRPNMESKRQEVHERFNEHLTQPAAPVRFGGPLFNAAGERCGVLLIIEAKDFPAAEAFLGRSPYQATGLYERTEVTELRPEIGLLR